MVVSPFLIAPSWAGQDESGLQGPEPAADATADTEKAAVPVPIIARLKPGPLRDAANGVAQEFAACAAYFAIYGEGMKRAGEIQHIEKSEQARKSLLNHAALLVGPKLAAARFDSELEHQGELISWDMSRLGELQSKYGDLCVNAVQNPQGRVEDYKVTYQLDPDE